MKFRNSQSFMVISRERQEWVKYDLFHRDGEAPAILIYDFFAWYKNGRLYDNTIPSKMSS